MAPLPRFAAWLVTGPVGHFVAGAADMAVLFARYWWERAHGRRPW